MWLGIPKPMIPCPLLGQGVVRIVGSHLGYIPTCSEVPEPPPSRQKPLPHPNLIAPPRTPPSAPHPHPHPPRGPPATVSWEGSWHPKLRSHLPHDLREHLKDIVPILISGALGPQDIRRYSGHMTWDPCAQPFPRP